ncbi:MAG: SPFH domain-containing protein [Candidatus Omnitrophica bacterium]|nr:SPFH domain-containing protein [Candidatus Omnitrophota bacterium]MCA9440689.1 SPFH domain-containing protein [Candidatus Omnitrophota bacterium]MCB9768911.1 SPFH domain-containing protein [Candidatus Omnitrophota bacterium]MCB9783393.1 SPFH domain-containing protein [Candidatus Omnitrophota bacterium]
MTQEIERKALSGWLMLAINIAMYLLSIYLFIDGVMGLERRAPWGGWMVGGSIFLLLLAIFVSVGFMIVQPNQAGVLVLFGNYKGSVKKNGFYWVNPLMSKWNISLRARNLNGERLKVNDYTGNPIEIALIVVWRVKDTYSALFDVDDYEYYVQTQSESALRHLASSYPYDSWEETEDTVSLRGDIDKVSEALEKELTERLWKAGVIVEEARLSHLAYAQEVAEAMLKRQQASAIVSARKTIVDGAVGMVEMALERLEKEGVVELDEEKKASMVSNLLVVLCGEREAHPVINTGTLYG